MDQRFRLLAAQGGRRDRQATLRATFDWSWDLLTEVERSALAQLSVFEGGFTLEAAEAVVDLSRHGSEAWVVDALHSLVDKSFVRRVDDARHDLLVSVQEYAAEKLQALQDALAGGAEGRLATQLRHAEYFAGPGSGGGHGLADLDNLVAACRRAAAAGSGTVALATLERAWALLQLHGPFALGIELARATGDMTGLEASSRARVEQVLGAALKASGNVAQAQSRLLIGLELARTCGERHAEGELLAELGHLYRNRSDFEQAGVCLQSALRLARELGVAGLECSALNGLANIDHELGLFESAREQYEQALRVARQAGERRWEGGLLGNLGNLLWDAGELDAAIRHIQQGLAIAREVGSRTWEANALCNLGMLHFIQGAFDAARAESELALHMARTMGHARGECIVQCNLGIASTSLGDFVRARQHFDAALALARQLQDRRSEGQFLGYLAQMLARSGNLDDARRCIADADRLLQPIGDPMSLGLLHCQRSEVEQIAGNGLLARAEEAAARRIHDELKSSPNSELGLALARLASGSGPAPA
jgi:tetratricopeptide (TPR) repeat protein